MGKPSRGNALLLYTEYIGVESKPREVKHLSAYALKPFTRSNLTKNTSEMDPIATETTETPVAESKVTEKVVEDVEDSPVVASGEESEAAPVVVEDSPAAAAEAEKEKEDETPAVESSGVAEVVTENGKKEAEVVEPVVEAEESVKRKVIEEDASEVPEKRAKTDEAEVVEPAEEVTA